jgi:hypothetical protein
MAELTMLELWKSEDEELRDTLEQMRDMNEFKKKMRDFLTKQKDRRAKLLATWRHAHKRPP